MARYKVLRSVAHSFGHSFASALNYWEGDYALGHLLRAARRTRQPSLKLDILSGKPSPAELLTPGIRASLTRYTHWFPKLVVSHKTQMIFLASATMEITFDLSQERMSRYSSVVASPYVCRVVIVDDRGVEWAAEQRGWWAPEPPSPPSRRLGRRLAGALRRIWARFQNHPFGIAGTDVA